MANGVVIIGGGQAGFQAAASLRAGGYQEPVRILGEEALSPYQRPPLSKGLLLGKATTASLTFRPDAFYADQRIDLRLSEPVASIDRTARTVTMASGSAVAYDHLVIATGTRVRPLPVAGGELDGVVYLRSVADSLDLIERLKAAESVVVIGGGFIGLEVAASARMLGRTVAVVEATPRLMGRVVAPLISDYFLDFHRRHGTEILLEAKVEAIAGDGGKVRSVRLAGGRTLPADLVVVGIGVMPNSELADAAGLACRDGILVDAAMRTSDPGIFAVGDVARHHNRFADGEVRLESVQNAIDQAKTAAAAILGGKATYDVVPWFWTDQYDAKLQLVGWSAGHDRTVHRGDPASGRFSVFHFGSGRLLAIDSVNRPADHMAGRRILAAGTPLTPDEAADESFDLKKLVIAATA